MVDVRDVAKAHRMAAESSNAKNGSRYILSASDTSGEMFTWELQAKLRELFPHIENIGGERMEKDKPAKLPMILQDLIVRRLSRSLVCHLLRLKIL